MRVTENRLAGNFLLRAQEALARMAAAQERIATGKKFLRPSDDPSALAKAMGLTSDLRRTEAYRENASAATAFMSLTESSLQELSDHLAHAKELVVQGVNAPTEGEGADSIAVELRAMIDAVLNVANREVGDRSLFGGHVTRSRPWARVGEEIVYRGDRGEILEELGPGLRLALNLTGVSVFEAAPARIGGVDLDPAVSRITTLAELKNGTGMMGGRILVTDSNGVAAEVDLLGATSVGDVLDGINHAGTAVLASLGADGKTIELTDTAGGTRFSVEDVLGGDLAASLGLAGTSTTGTRTSADLDPALGPGTAVALLGAGAGLTPGSFTIRTEGEGGTRTATIDPSSANTVGDLLRLFENALAADGEPLALTARIEDRALVLESRRTGSRVSVTDDGGGGVAKALGLAGAAGPTTVFALLEQAARAVESRDHAAMDSALRTLGEAVDRTAGVRGAYGARARQALRIAEHLQDRSVDLTLRLSDVEDADLAQEAIELTRAETVYNASLATGTRLLERSLFDYLG